MLPGEIYRNTQSHFIVRLLNFCGALLCVIEKGRSRNLPSRPAGAEPSRLRHPKKTSSLIVRPVGRGRNRLLDRMKSGHLPVDTRPGDNDAFYKCASNAGCSSSIRNRQEIRFERR